MKASALGLRPAGLERPLPWQLRAARGSAPARDYGGQGLRPWERSWKEETRGHKTSALKTTEINANLTQSRNKNTRYFSSRFRLARCRGVDTAQPSDVLSVTLSGNLMARSLVLEEDRITHWVSAQSAGFILKTGCILGKWDLAERPGRPRGTARDSPARPLVYLLTWTVAEQLPCAALGARVPAAGSATAPRSCRAYGSWARAPPLA